MALFRIMSTAALLATAAAQFGDYGLEGHGFDSYHAHKPVLHTQVQSIDHDHHEDLAVDYHAHPKYTFDYSVKDPHTGDDKEHWETRDGDKVKGTYTLLETDGTKRVVEYEADDKNGFNAVVHKIGTPKEHHEIKHIPHEIPHDIPKAPSHLFEPSYHHDFQNFDDGGFVPIVGGFGH
ncbi:adult-specific cuticular protein ACP-22-like [Plodia interpunctella]|uniref:adult-specific cuticular protein ACP-22-like n=1 Tax=Plodia interpunctella TaxID=58824 RepID=UPI0023684521|nr:adult-specific cuticular protein ACP-22-like [Plodia interpunctella]